jgi:hypothetical protein
MSYFREVNWLWWGKNISFGCKENFKLVNTLQVKV